MKTVLERGCKNWRGHVIVVSLVDMQLEVRREVGGHNKLSFVPWEIALLQPKFPLAQLSVSLALISFPSCLFLWLKSSFLSPSHDGSLPLCHWEFSTTSPECRIHSRLCIYIPGEDFSLVPTQSFIRSFSGSKMKLTDGCCVRWKQAPVWFVGCLQQQTSAWTEMLAALKFYLYGFFEGGC